LLHLSPTPATLWTGITAVVLAGTLSFLIWKRSPHRARTAALEAIRMLAVLTVVILLWQPEWRTIIRPDTKPKITILWDDSKSMETIDATLPPDISGTTGAVSRAAWTRKTLASEVWKPLAADGANVVETIPFATPDPDHPARSGSDLDQPLTDLLENETNLRAVVMISDGDANLGQPPVVAAQKMRLRGIPVFTVPVGSPSRLPDLDLLTVAAPTYGIVGENVQIPFSIRSSLDRQVRTIVRLRDDAGREQTRDITLPPDAETHDSILWRIDREGTSTLRISIPMADGELTASNNAREFTIAGRPEKIRVLVIETLPRWEYRFLRNALSRDPGVELSCLLFHPSLGPGSGSDYIQAFPDNPAELSKYDVIFIGDVGTGPDQLTADQCGMIRGLVENQASGVVFLPGPQGNQQSLLDTPLADLVPVFLEDDKPAGYRETTAAPLTLTSEGRTSLLTMLGNDERENPEIWRRLPGFHWHAAVIRAKAGSEVLAVHGNRRGRYGPVPLLVTKPAGNGKVLFMGIDSAWRWRRGVEDLYHYRFWGQVARWMSYQRNMAAGQRLRMFFTPERPQPGTTVTLNANAFDANGAPLAHGTVAVDITAPDGRTQRITLEKNNSAWGAFSGRFKVDLPGPWKLHATTPDTPDTPLETTLLAQGVEIEKNGHPARPDVLDEIARVSRGRVIQPAQLADLVREINALPEPRPRESRIQLWSHWATLCALTLLLATFWTGRKLNGTF
jgi:hypothetical protein